MRFRNLHRFIIHKPSSHIRPYKSGGMPNIMSGGMPNIMSGGMPSVMSNGMPGVMSNGMPGVMSNGMPNIMLNGMISIMSGGMLINNLCHGWWTFQDFNMGLYTHNYMCDRVRYAIDKTCRNNPTINLSFMNMSDTDIAMQLNYFDKYIIYRIATRHFECRSIQTCYYYTIKNNKITNVDITFMDHQPMRYRHYKYTCAYDDAQHKYIYKIIKEATYKSEF